MKAFLKYNWPYLLLYSFILVFAGYILLHYGKVQIHQVINAQVGNKYLGEFFKYITHIGDGLFSILIVVIFLFINVRKSMYIFMTYIVASLFTTFLKRMIYTDAYRPFHVFLYYIRQKLNLVDGVEMLGENSFPSGHSTSAFALFFCLIFITRNQTLKFIFFILACTAAFSRTYISQHWLVDIYIGSIIGTCGAILFYFVFYHTHSLHQWNTTLPRLLSKNKEQRV